MTGHRDMPLALTGNAIAPGGGRKKTPPERGLLAGAAGERQAAAASFNFLLRAAHPTSPSPAAIMA